MSLTELLLATQDPRRNAQAEAQIKQAESANAEQHLSEEQAFKAFLEPLKPP